MIALKKLYPVLGIVLLLGCTDRTENTPVAPAPQTFDPQASGVVLLKQGTLMGIGHTVSGTVKIYAAGEQYHVVFDPFTSQNGPDLRVYLSEDANATAYLNLGLLKSTTGFQSYPLPGKPDLARYPYVIIWCQQYTVLFARAAVQ